MELEFMMAARKSGCSLLGVVAIVEDDLVVNGDGICGFAADRFDDSTLLPTLFC